MVMYVATDTKLRSEGGDFMKILNNKCSWKPYVPEILNSPGVLTPLVLFSVQTRLLRIGLGPQLSLILILQRSWVRIPLIAYLSKEYALPPNNHGLKGQGHKIILAKK